MRLRRQPVGWLGDDRILVTPSACTALVAAGTVAVVDPAGVWLSDRTPGGGLRPTSELPMHLEAYRQRPDVRAVVHAHPPITVALSIAGIPMDTPCCRR